MGMIKVVCFWFVLFALEGGVLSEYVCNVGAGVVEVNELHPKIIAVLFTKSQTLTSTILFHVYSPTEKVNVTVERVGCVNCKHSIIEEPRLDKDCLYYFKTFTAWNDVGSMKYNVTAKFENVTNSTILDVEIHEPAHITEPPKSIRVFEGTNDVTIKCLARGYPLPDIKWIRNNKLITNATKYVIQHNLINSNIDERVQVSSELRIGDKDNTSYNDDGIYECFVANKIGYHKRPQNHSVAVKIDILVPIQPVYKELLFQANVSSDIHIFCAFRANPPPTHIHWNTPVYHQKEFDSPPTVNFTAQVKVQKGLVWYTCSAFNWIDKLKYESKVKIGILGTENPNDGYVTDPILIMQYTKDQVELSHTNEDNKILQSIFIPTFLTLFLVVFIWLLVKKQRTKIIWRSFAYTIPSDDSPVLIENEDGLAA